jgi:hypothetical protein
MIHEITSTDELAHTVAEGKAVVMFFTPATDPGQNIAASFIDLAPEFPGITFVKVDLDDVPDVSLAMHEPTFFALYEDGIVDPDCVDGEEIAKLRLRLTEWV